MLFAATKALGAILSVAFITSTSAHALCSIDVVIVKGRVDHAPSNAKVHVQLIYSKNMAGDSGEATVENGRFNIPIEFLTQSRRPLVNGLLEKCSRRPKTVIVTLVEDDQDRKYDRVSLDFAKDFRMADPSAYVLLSELVLNGSR
ncbi:MAG: hypothetical protein WB660_24285 [Candidatus Sulfotelmatobacter sp.]